MGVQASDTVARGGFPALFSTGGPEAMAKYANDADVIWLLMKIQQQAGDAVGGGGSGDAVSEVRHRGRGSKKGRGCARNSEALYGRERDRVRGREARGGGSMCGIKRSGSMCGIERGGCTCGKERSERA